MRQRASRIIGISLTVIAQVAFFTVADDLHHVGEFFAVTGVICSGLALFIAGQFPHLVRRFALGWMPVGIGIGILAGGLTDP
jgi:hypothetical protein